jgi:hypothetical protein
LGEESRKTRGRGKKSPGDKKVCRVFGGDHVESEVVSMDPCVAFPMRDRLGELVHILWFPRGGSANDNIQPGEVCWIKRGCITRGIGVDAMTIGINGGGDLLWWTLENVTRWVPWELWRERNGWRREFSDIDTIDLVGVDVVWIVIKGKEIGGRVEVKEVTDFVNKIRSLARGRVLKKQETRFVWEIIRMTITCPELLSWWEWVVFEREGKERVRRGK